MIFVKVFLFFSYSENILLIKQKKQT